MLYDRDNVEEILEEGETLFGHKWVRYVNLDGYVVEEIEYADGSRSYKFTGDRRG